MPQAQGKHVWCLARANEPPCVLSSRELLILAELGHLRADDLIWRSGSNAKRSIRSLLAAQKASPAPNKPLPAYQATAPAPVPAQEASIEASQVAPVTGTEAHRPHRKWANGRTLAGLAGAAVVLAALGVAAFLQSQPVEPSKPIATRLEPQSAEPAAAASQPAAPQPPVATDKVATGDATPPQPSIAADEVAVRKVKVLEIPAPPPGE